MDFLSPYGPLKEEMLPSLTIILPSISTELELKFTLMFLQVVIRKGLKKSLDTSTEAHMSQLQMDQERQGYQELTMVFW